MKYAKTITSNIKQNKNELHINKLLFKHNSIFYIQI